MLCRLLFLLLGLLTVAPASAWGQGAPRGASPGGELTWERVGDRPVDPSALAFDGADALYASDGYRFYALGCSGTSPCIWVKRFEGLVIDALFGLGPDTLVSTSSFYTQRSTDGGVTWLEAYDDGSRNAHGLYEAPAGTPLAGTLFVGHGLVAASTDRGATWEVRGDPPQGRAESFAALSTGRLVAGASWGGIYSDDGGWTWVKSDLWQYARYLLSDLAVVERPGGVERVIAVGVDATAPHVRAWYSDDGGETWLPEAGVPLPQVDFGVGRDNASVLALGGASAVAVLGRGSVYRTDDGGQTWAEVGRVPDINDDTSVQIAVLGPAGRLYVGLKGQGALHAWVYRTEEPVPVASEPGPEGAPEGLGLSVRPNPARGHTEVVVTLPEAGAVTAVLYDALGRRVAVIHEGVLAAGAHVLPFDPARSGLPAGVYVVRVRAGEVVASQRFTLVR